VPDALINIAPEKGEEVLALIKKHKIEFVLEDNPYFDFYATTVEHDHHRIAVSVRGLEVLWALSYLDWVLYRAAQEAARANSTSDFEFRAHEVAARAGALADWALTHAVDALTDTPWPADLPQPAAARSVTPTATGGATTTDVEEVSDERMADEIFLCAVAWILHHELAHIEAGHTDVVTVDSVADERAADAAATQWILDGVTDDIVIQKRGLGIAAATVALAALELQLPAADPHAARSHPKAAERLRAALSHTAFGGDHVVLYFAVIALKAHFDRAGLVLPRTRYDTAEECLDDYCTHFMAR
jgi:hypothetical protein